MMGVLLGFSLLEQQLIFMRGSIKTVRTPITASENQLTNKYVFVNLVYHIPQHVLAFSIPSIR
jgi:hypothetical protein